MGSSARQLSPVRCHPRPQHRRNRVCEKAFDYLEQRLTGECSANYNCEHFYEVCRLVQVFDPALAVEVGCDVKWVALMHATIKGFSENINLSSLIAQLPA